jgi:hypothetical protein
LANAQSGAGLLMFGLSNTVDAVTDDQGWTVLPYGMWPHTAGYQKFFKPEADRIVTAFKSVAGRLKKAIFGRPVYKGHPDNPAMANEFPDKTEYGQVCDMEARESGLAIRHVLSNAGVNLVEKKKLDRISPNWFVEDTGEKLNGRTVYSPTEIKSVGLTAKPNIPNLSLVNTQPDSMDPLKEALLKLLALANEATDEQIVAAVTERNARPEATALANEKNNLATVSAENIKLKSDLAAEKQRADAGAIALANQKATTITSLVNEAVKAGKILAADVPTWTRMFETDLDGAKKILANTKSAMKTEPKAKSDTLADADKVARAQFANGGSDDDANMDGDTIGNSGKIQKLVNEEMKAMSDCGLKGNSLRNKAWGNVKKNFPKLFAPTNTPANA